MDASEFLSHPVAPLGVPFYPLRPTRFTDRTYLNVLYRTDAEAFRRLLPEPLRVGDPLVRFEVMRMTDVEGFGPYCESGQLLTCEFEGEQVEYSAAMYVDNVPAIVAGRELSAYPKVGGNPAMRVQDGAVIGTLDMTGERVATATMAYKWERLAPEAAAEEIRTPTVFFKAVPDAVTGSLQSARLLRTSIDDVTIKGAWSGPARLHLTDHVLAPMADLPVREIVSATYIVTDLTLRPAIVCHDYLSDRASTKDAS